MTPPDAHHAPARTREEIVEAIIKDAYDRDLFSGVDDDIRTEIEYSWRELASLTPAPPSAPATAEVRERRRFVDWPTGDIVKQLRQQAAEQLDPEYSGFLIAAADRLMSLTAPTTAEVRATFMREIERRRFNVPGDTRWFVRPSDALDALDAVLAALSVAALAGAATFKDGVEAAAKCAEAFHIDDDAMDRQVKRIVAQRIRALTPPAASQDSGAFDMRAFAVENRARCEAPNGFNHPMSSWSLSDWMTATLGELGEAANVAKKLNRVRDGITGNSEAPEQLRSNLADEIADAFIYLDLLAQSEGIDLATAVRTKFDKTSAKIGYSK